MGSWVREGSVTFSILGLDKPCSTWYKIFGDLNSDKVPLIILHGGSGACHEYPLALADLTSNYSIPTIFYDQIGKGRSTHLRETAGDEAFWSVPLFLAELSNLIAQLHIDTFDLYGHSWGGMLAAEFAAGNPPGLRRLVISNSLASMATWRVGVEMLRGRLPKAVQEALERCEREGDWESEEYEGAVEVFMKRHGYLKRPWPVEEVELVVGWLKEDATTCRTLYGPSELTITGSLRDWSCIDKLRKIEAETLLLNGYQDEAQDVCMRPFFQHIRHVRWITLDNAAHFSHVDQRERYMEHAGEFLIG